MAAKVVVIGVGNPLLGDEGLGIAAVERLKKRPLPRTVEVVDAGTDSLDALLDAKDAERVIIVDAVDAAREPGTLIRLSADDLFRSESEPLLSLHQLSLKESLCLAELTGFDRRKLLVIGMQPEKVEPSMSLSDAVEERMDSLICEIEKEIRGI